MAKSVKMPDGAVINFPDEMDDATIHSEGMKYMNQAQQRAAQSGDLGNSPAAQGTYERKDVDTGIDIARPFVANVAGGAAAALAAPTGPGAFVARTGAYSVVDALMQYLKEKKPDSPLDALGEGAKQSLLNSGMNKLLQLGGRTVGAIRNADQPEILNFSPTTSQALKATGTGNTLIRAGAKGLEDLALSSKQAALERTAGKGFVQALQTARDNGFNFSRNPNTMLSLIGQGDPSLNSFNVVDKVIRDPDKLEQTLTTAQQYGVGANLMKSLQGYQFMKMVNDASERSVMATGAPITDGVVKIDPQKLDAVWTDPEMQDSLKKLYNSQQRADIKQFFQNVTNTQDKASYNPIARKFLMIHGGISLAAGLFTGHLTGGAITAASVSIPAEVVGTLLSKPSVARLMVNLAGGGPLGMSDSFAGRILVNALQGETIAIQDAQGQAHPGTLKDGKFVPQGQ